MTEAVVVLPLLLLFFMGILEAGRTAGTVARAAQSAYNATLVGGKTSRSIRFGTMNQRASDLNSLMVHDLINISMTPTENTSNRTVSFAYQADLQAIFPRFDWGLGLKFTGPDLVLSSSTSINLNQFGNGACWYNCNLQATGSCSWGGGYSCSGPLPPDPRTTPGNFTLEMDGSVALQQQWHTLGDLEFDPLL